jgi:hypothetical protein
VVRLNVIDFVSHAPYREGQGVSLASPDSEAEKSMGHDPLLDRKPRSAGDANAAFLGDSSQGGLGNHAGPEMAVYRLVRWLFARRRNRR